MRKINSQVMKYHNAMLIVRTVQKHAPISRTELTQLVGLTTASVINITNALMKAGILVQIGLANGSSQGRKAVLLSVNPDAAYVLGAEIDTEAVTVGLGDFCGSFVNCVRTPISPLEGYEKILNKLSNAVERCVRESGVERGRILGMGMALPGPLDSEAGILINPPNFPDWDNVPVKDILEKRLGFQICCDRETNDAALAEYYLGAAAGYKTVFFLSLFKFGGVGGGMIANGNVLHGFRDGAGEIGHTTVDPAGVQCTCGNYGCLEALVSGKALVSQAKQLYKMNVDFSRSASVDADTLTLEDVFRLSSEGDEVCLHVVKQAAAYISIALGNVINLCSPELIVIGGTLPPMSPQLVQLIRDHIRQKSYPRHCSEIRVIEASFGDLTFAKGAVVQALNAFTPDLIASDFDQDYMRQEAAL
jgi:N-acetylglucosamine repressor